MTFPTGGKYPLKVTSWNPGAARHAAVSRRRNHESGGRGGARASAHRQFDSSSTAAPPAASSPPSRRARGAKVALLEPGKHLGGMVSGGLGWTDFGKKEVIGGYSLEFFERVGKKYGTADRVALRAARRRGGLPGACVPEAGVSVFFGQRLREKTGVRKDGARIAAIRMENGAGFTASVFIDATYEGD